MSEYQSELYKLAVAKRRHLRAAKDLDVALGRVARDMIASGDQFTQSKVARMLGVSHTTVQNLMALANSALESDRQERVTVLRASAAGRYVKEQDAAIETVIAAFEASDVLNLSELDPRLFTDEGSWFSGRWVPNMLWRLSTGEWVAVEDVSVGYGGVGPRNGLRALVDAGLDEDTASDLVASRVTVARKLPHSTKEDWFTSTQWPVTSRNLPILQDGKIIVACNLRRPTDSWRPLNRQNEPDHTGFYPSPTPTDNLSAWLGLLDAPLPWARGPRVGRVFRTEEAAAAQGFTMDSGNAWGHRGDASPQVVIEQGDIQLWCLFEPLTYDERAHGKLLPADAYDVLERAGIFTDTLADLERREASLLQRLARSMGHATAILPEWIDLPQAGDTTLNYIPANTPA
ncbi:MAG TPA: hypothetical protein H9987_00565 [Candidatus Luteococcus avicola]|nr:hypothetical protein [Candidatus Luteococcus avicola]